MTSQTKVKILPHSKENEMMVLGCMLTSINSLNISAESLEESDFYFKEHKIIFQVLKTFYKKDKPADIHLIFEELKRQDKLNTIGGLDYLTTLAQYAGTSAFIEEYIEQVKDKSLLREMIRAANLIERTALEEPLNVGEFLKDSKKTIQKIEEANTNVTFNYLLENNSEEKLIEELKNISPSVSTGFMIGDESVKIPGGAISVIAMPTSHGKTATLINFSLGVLNHHHDKSVYFFTYEESGASIQTLFLNTYINKEISKNNRESIKSHFINGNVEHVKTDERQNFLNDKKSFFDHLINKGRLKVFYSDMFVEELISSIHFIKKNTNVGLICIDYMQLLRLRKWNQGNRQEELKQICLILKNCAIETGLPILLGAQFSRQVTMEADLSPIYIREAADIEHIANLVIGGWNRNFTGFTKDGNKDKNGRVISKESVIYFEIMKGRGIGNGHNSVLNFNGNTGKLENQVNTNKTNSQTSLFG